MSTNPAWHTLGNCPDQATCPLHPIPEALIRAVDHSVRPAVDRAIERDHSLCGAEPCSDCR